MSAKPVASENRSGKPRFGRPAIPPLAVAPACSLLAYPVCAQSRVAVSDERSPSFKRKEVIVTARKQIQNIRSVAESVEVINAAELAARPITRIDDSGDLQWVLYGGNKIGHTIKFIVAGKKRAALVRASE